MKVITLRQPWATLVAEGYKKVEFRSWTTKYRGDLLIHAGSGVDREYMTRFKHLNLEYPSSKIIAKVTLADCVPMTKKYLLELKRENPIVYKSSFYKETFGWQLTNIQKLEKPIAAKGKLRLWNYEIEEFVYK